MKIEEARAMAAQWKARPRHPLPGTVLKELLAKMGVEPEKCGCNQMVAKMNKWGAACKDHVEEIVRHLAREATARKWRVPFKNEGATGLVKLAIWLADRKFASNAHKKK